MFSWILACKAPKKNVFANNRLKEIDSIINQIKFKFVAVNLAYVPSLHNLAELVTKPCSANVLLEKTPYLPVKNSSIILIKSVFSFDNFNIILHHRV